MTDSDSKHIVILEGRPRELDELRRAFAEACGPSSLVETIGSAAELIDLIRSDELLDLVVVDYFLGDGRQDGVAVVQQVREHDPVLPVVVVAEKGDVDLVTRAVKAGATDFLVRAQHLSARVSTQMMKIRGLLEVIEHNRALGNHCRVLREAQANRNRIVGHSPQIQEVQARIDRVARVPRPVLITGERGTGKELVARAIHRAAGHDDLPFVVVNCAAFSDTLLESELFGHEKGAFTGAHAMARGKFEQADGGTIFLDEIGNMSLPFQQKILRVVEYGTFTRVGGSVEIQARPRIIAATNVDLHRAMEAGKFLRDLYDRLSFEIIHLPPLRERTGDVEVLARFFLDQFMREVPAFQGKTLDPLALEILNQHHFPGNVRELKNIIERAVYRDTTNEINPEDIDMLPGPASAAPAETGSFKDRVEALEKKLVHDAMAQSGGNQAQAARLLGLTYHQFRYYLKKYEDA